jgi:hypothetical protein
VEVNVGQLTNDQLLRIATAAVEIATDQRIPPPLQRWWSDLAASLITQVVHRSVSWAEFLHSTDAHDVNRAAAAWLADQARTKGP